MNLHGFQWDCYSNCTHMFHGAGFTAHLQKWTIFGVNVNTYSILDKPISRKKTTYSLFGGSFHFVSGEKTLVIEFVPMNRDINPGNFPMVFFAPVNNHDNPSASSKFPKYWTSQSGKFRLTFS